MSSLHPDSRNARLERLRRVQALLSANPVVQKPRRIGWFAILGTLVGAVAMSMTLAGFVPMRAGASAKTQPVFTVPDPIVKMASISPQTTVRVDHNPLARPMIALVIDDIGPARAWSQMALDLPMPVTMAILPYVPDAANWAIEAKAAGHEVLLHMPMEPFGLEDPGPGALLRRLSADQNRQRLTAALERVPGVIGVNNHMGSRFTSCARCVAEVADLLHDRGLLFLDSVTSGKSAAARIVGKTGVPIIRRDVFLDDLDTPAAIATQMLRAEKLAIKNGVVVVIAHPRPASMAALKTWPESLEKQGIKMVSLRAAMAQRQALERGLHLHSAGL
ncbi:MAG: divergent polysaccharide deacetylase family protein [Robiginitomaculum sp.]|nr:divergent polysaccharide deacetylase family protein [Robiginitomaculum sp.]MDQ7077188.1 divergent polysaccharide deacetylase family protein [Robiginitomaculum sp.]